MIPEPLPVAIRASIRRIMVSMARVVSGVFAKLDFPLKVARPS